MPKSLVKQIALIVFLGPLGLFYTSVLAALTVTLATLLTLYFAGEQLNTERLAYLLATIYFVSFCLGIYLVKAFNRKNKNDFQFSNYYGDVSCKTVRRESANRDYHRTLASVKRKRNRKYIQATCLTIFLPISVAFMMKPHLISFVTQPPQATATLQATPDTAAAITARNTLTRSSWFQRSQGSAFNSQLTATDYTNSSDGPYLPIIQISCDGTDNYTAGLRVKEILGTETATVLVSLDNNPPYKETWTLDPSYQYALTPSTSTLITQLKRAEHIAISYIPFGEQSQKTASFNLKGSSAEIDAFYSKCQQLLQVASIQR